MKGSLNIEQMEFLAAKGCSVDEMIAFAKMAGPVSKGAARTAKWRARKAGNVTESVTSDVTGDASPPPIDNHTPPVSSNDETKGKSKRAAIGAPAKPDDVSDPVWTAFKQLRAKKGGLSDIALAGIRREATKAGWGLEAALTRCIEKNWQGFEAEWVAKADAPTGDGYLENLKRRRGRET